MSEIEKMQRAKMYIDKLAAGINPIDDSEVPPNDIVRNQRVVNCFRYISEILSKQAGTRTPQKKELPPFFLPHEQRNLFEYSDTPLFGSEILKQVNSLAESFRCKKLKSKHFFYALTKIGLIGEVITADNVKFRCPTEFGLNNGVILEQNFRSDGSKYSSIKYQQAAQRFIIDNIDAIAEICSIEEHNDKIKKENIRADAPLQGSVWTREQEQILIEMFNQGMSAAKISERMKRTTGGIASKLKKLGLIENKSDFTKR